MINKILVLAGLFFCLSGYSNPIDSTLFNTDFEHTVFKKIASSDPVDSIDLFLALDYATSSAKERIQSFSKDLKNKIEDYPVNKKLKTIFKSVHDEFLTKYTQDAYFNDIFKTGNYNCVSASALYAIILDNLNISYIIKQTPVHVYLVADPVNSSFVIETTLPGEKIVQYDERFKIHYIEYLHNNKIISESEFNNSSVDELFAANYSKDKTISLKGLAGLHYYNKGVFQYNKSSFNEALISFEKANILTSDELIKFMLNNALVSVMNIENQKKTYHGKILARYMLANDSNAEGIQYSKEYFDAVSAELIVNHPNVVAYKKYFSELKNDLGTIDKDMVQKYYFFLGYNSSINFRYSEALAYLGNSYKYNPENINTKELITQAVTRYMMNDKNHNMAIDSLNAYFERFPYLKQDKIMVNYLEYCYARTVETLLRMDYFSEGNQRLKEYEAFLKANPDFEPNKEYIKVIYQGLTWYHLRMNNNDLAEQALRKGIRLLPEEEDLKGMLRTLMYSKGGNYEYPELMNDSKPIKKYLLAMAKAKDNMDDINANAGKYLVREWQLNKIIDAGIEKDAPADIRVIFTLMENHQAACTAGNEKMTGKWNYNPLKCILDISMDKEKEGLHIIITQITSAKMVGVMYRQTDYENSFEIVMNASVNQ
jgi:hypothetical protein